MVAMRRGKLEFYSILAPLGDIIEPFSSELAGVVKRLRAQSEK
jgi:hypothetical protein